jgi:protein gp37
MAENTGIEWCDHTFNPWEGCQKVAPECDNCYAEARDQRFTGGTLWGPHAQRRRTSVANWQKPCRWNDQADAFEAEHGRRQRVFCASLGDLFDNAVPPEWRTDLFNLIRSTPRLDWLLLTKRPQNIAKMLPPDWGAGWDNVWLGTSAGTQKTVEQNIPALLGVPARVHFLSAEPLLEPVDLQGIPANLPPAPSGVAWDWFNALTGQGVFQCAPEPDQPADYPRLDWVICGGESGYKARPMHPDWARGLRGQCAAAGVAFLFKQWGEWAPEIDRDADDPDWQADYTLTKRQPGRYRILNVEGGQGFHGERVHVMKRAGKKAAGRLLDGRTHDGMPI